nr:DUF411 domain-containing protein [Nitrogeniibacter mangrovi]
MPLLAAASLAQAEAPAITMYKDPNCGCCSKWAEHMRAAGFEVHEVHSAQMGRVKQQLGIPEALSSCHTARIGRYLVEGHVPAADVKRLLAEQPDVAGLSAPGMPAGSPGMEGPYPAQRYEVVSFERSGGATVFARH